MEDIIGALKQIAKTDFAGEGDEYADQKANRLISIAREELDDRGIDYE